MKNKFKIIFAGGLIGIFGAVLVFVGNPVNMGICIACFYRDITGALGLHRASVVQYLRPEIMGFVLGAFIIAKLKKEFKPRGGSSPLIRFFFGFFLIVGALVFLGCPLRMILRLANGDLNALVGLGGYITGIVIGIRFLKIGFTIGRSVNQPKIAGYSMPIISIVLLVFLFIAPSFIFFSESGPGSYTAPIIWSLAAGLLIGGTLQRTRLCTAGGFRDVILIKDFHLMWGLIGIFIFSLIGNLVLNPDKFMIGFSGQPVAHSEHIWNFLGMVLVGLTAVLLGGCPLRQTILADEGDTDAVITIFGFIAGSAFVHNFGLAASPKGVPQNGKIAVVIGIIVVLSIAFIIAKETQRKRKLSKEAKGGQVSV